MAFLAVLLGGALGAVCRYLIHQSVRVPLGTLLVNVAGSFLAGVVAGWATGWWAIVFGPGFCGGFTTYSTFALETGLLPPRRAAAYVTATVVAGLAAAWLGHRLTG